MANGNIVLQRLEAQPEAASIARDDLLWIEQLQAGGAFVSKKVSASNLPGGAGAEVSVYYGVSARRADFNDAAATATAAAAAGFAGRMEKALQRLKLGSLIVITAPAAAGYYFPFIAVPTAGLGALRFYDENWNKDNYWVRAPDQSVGAAAHQLYSRRFPIKQSASIETIVKDF